MIPCGNISSSSFLINCDALYKNIEPGKIVEVREDRHFVVKTGDGLIELIRFDRQFTPHAGIYL